MEGISFLLYGMIAASGLRLLVDEKVNYAKARNLAMSSVIFVTGLSGAAITIGKVQFQGNVPCHHRRNGYGTYFLYNRQTGNSKR